MRPLAVEPQELLVLVLMRRWVELGLGWVVVVLGGPRFSVDLLVDRASS